MMLKFQEKKVNGIIINLTIFFVRVGIMEDDIIAVKKSQESINAQTYF